MSATDSEINNVGTSSRCIMAIKSFFHTSKYARVLQIVLKM